jgi:DNA-binding NarL/FixJ family response regulator
VSGALFGRRLDRVLVASGDPGLLADLKRSLGSMRLEVSVTDTAPAAIDLAWRFKPAAIVVDVELASPSLDLRFVEMAASRPRAAVVLVTGRNDSRTIAAVARRGDCAVLRRPLDARQFELTMLVALERRVQGSGPVETRASESTAPGPTAEPLFQEVLQRIAAELRRAGVIESGAPAPCPLLSGLRPREQEVVGLLVRHYRVPAIASELGISPQTVRNHLKRVFRQLGVHSQQELLARVA